MPITPDRRVEALERPSTNRIDIRHHRCEFGAQCRRTPQPRNEFRIRRSRNSFARDNADAPSRIRVVIEKSSGSIAENPVSVFLAD
jgi:hypothetical protein